MLIIELNIGNVDSLIRFLNEKKEGDNEIFVTCDCTGGSFHIHMQPATMYKGLKIYMTKTDSTINSVTVYPFPGETIGSFQNVSLTVPGQSMLIISDGLNLL